MNNIWLRELDLCPEYEQTDRDSSKHIQELAFIIATRLKAVKRFSGASGDVLRVNQQRDQLVHHFLMIAGNPLATVDDFNQQVVGLFNWGDTILRDDSFKWLGKVCLIKIDDGEVA